MSGTNSEIATFGGGCFWCTEAVFKELRGVQGVVSGYAGGQVDNPSYQAVCSGTTGHAELVQITFDPEQVSYADLLRVFFATHDPTTKDRQGHDIGSQYRSIVMYHSDQQRDTALAIIDELTRAGIYPVPFVTQVVPATKFWPAEAYHQNYFERNPGTGYCAAVVAPKVIKFRKSFADRLRG